MKLSLRDKGTPDLDQPDSTLTPKQARAIAALVGGAGIKEAAEAAGVCRATLWSWASKDENFGRALTEETRALRRNARLSLAAGAETAVKTLTKAAADGDAQAGAALLRLLALYEKRGPEIDVTVTQGSQVVLYLPEKVAVPLAEPGGNGGNGGNGKHVDARNRA